MRKNCSQTFTSPSKLFFPSNMDPERFLDQFAQPTDRNRVPADVLCLAAGEATTDSGDEDASIATADSADSSTDQDTQVEGSLLSPVAGDIEQYELMTVAYTHRLGGNLTPVISYLGKTTTSFSSWKWSRIGGHSQGFRFPCRK